MQPRCGAARAGTRPRFHAATAAAAAAAVYRQFDEQKLLLIN